MIQKISFENYKAFEKGEIKLKPITILLGANSVGKSSIINLLLMLQQTANSSTYKSALRLHGENVSMGECENIFRQKNTTRNISIEFEFKSKELKDLLESSLFEELIYYYCYPIAHMSRHLDKTDIQQINVNQFVSPNGEINPDIYYQSKKLFQELRRAIDRLNIDSELNTLDLFKYWIKQIDDTRNSSEAIDTLYDFLSKSRSLIKEDIFCLFVELCYVESKRKEKVLKIQGMKILQGDNEILCISFEHSTGKKTTYSSLSVKTGLLHQGSPQNLLDEKAK